MSLEKIIDFSNWDIIKDEFLDINKSVDLQKDFLIEDMFQCNRNLKNNINLILDIGWYGEYLSDEGLFKCYIIKEHDWDNPIFKYSTKNVHEMINLVKEIVILIESVV